jgi:diaminohydroxyphosphoribosylaminopyrimidine deaminase / 5-amino-6-(5-phosphoribosylamino)uracil reductase
MQQALDAALAVRGLTSPNPWVGAVAVRDGRVIAAGATAPPGGAHAEAAALEAARDGARGADVFVTLEPCAPFAGKRTRSCAERLVVAGVRRVIVALEDPDRNVTGRGIAILREAGVEVVMGDGAEAASRQLRPYLKHRQTGRPYVIAKFAASLDGRTATSTGDSKWITGEASRERVHQERAWVDAIMVGSGTVVADDPSLTARPGGELAARQPVRIVLDSRGRMSPGARLFREPGRTIVATTSNAPGDWKRGIDAAGAQLVECEAGDAGLNLEQLLAALGERGILSIWAEGGGTLLGSLFAGRHIDEVWAFLAPVIIGSEGRPAVAWSGARTMADVLRLEDVEMEQLGSDVLVHGYTGWWRP